MFTRPRVRSKRHPASAGKCLRESTSYECLSKPFSVFNGIVIERSNRISNMARSEPKGIFLTKIRTPAMTIKTASIVFKVLKSEPPFVAS